MLMLLLMLLFIAIALSITHIQAHSLTFPNRTLAPFSTIQQPPKPDQLLATNLCLAAPVPPAAPRWPWPCPAESRALAKPCCTTQTVRDGVRVKPGCNRRLVAGENERERERERTSKRASECICKKVSLALYYILCVRVCLQRVGLVSFSLVDGQCPAVIMLQLQFELFIHLLLLLLLLLLFARCCCWFKLGWVGSKRVSPLYLKPLLRLQRRGTAGAGAGGLVVVVVVKKKKKKIERELQVVRCRAMGENVRDESRLGQR